MAATQDYTEDMAQGDFSNESYGDYAQTEQQLLQEPKGTDATETSANEAMEEATNGDGHDSQLDPSDGSGKDEDR